MLAEAAPLCTRPAGGGDRQQCQHDEAGFFLCMLVALRDTKPLPVMTSCTAIFTVTQECHQHHMHRPWTWRNWVGIHADRTAHHLPVGLVYMTLPTVMLQVPGCLSGELLME
jgi:hypothetical protein